MKLFSKSELLRNLGVLVSGTALAQIIPVLVQLYIRREYDSAVFGVFEVYLSITAILVVISGLKYEMTIVLPKEDEKSGNLLALSLSLNFIINFIAFIIILFFRNPLAEFLNWDLSYVDWMLLIPLSAWLFSSNQSLNYYLIRIKAFKASAFNKLFRRIVEGGVQSGGGFLGYTGGLFWGEMLGRLAIAISAWIQVLRKGFSFKGVSVKTVKEQAKRYIEFPKFQAIPALLNTASLWLPAIMINKFFSPEITAQFGLSRQVLLLPLALISVSMSQVLFQTFSERKNNNQSIRPLVRKSGLSLFAMSVPGIAIMWFFGEEIFSFVFGSQWADAGYYTKVLAFAYAAQFVVSPISIVLIALEKVKISAIWQIFYFASIISLTFFRNLEIMDFITVFAIVNVVAYLVYWLILIKVVADYEKNI